jgi:hypothetical protein
MIQHQKGLFLLVALAAIAATGLILPAYADEKITSYQGPFIVNPTISACGSSFDSEIIALTTTTTWVDKNGIETKKHKQVDVETTLYDELGEIVGKGKSTTMFKGSDEDLPKRINEHTKMICFNGESNEIINSVFILHKDGKITSK